MKVLIFSLLFLFLILSFGIASAEDGVQYNLIQPLPGLQSVSGSNPFLQYIQKIIPILLGLAAVLAVVMITFYGIEYAISEAVGTKQQAIEGIQQAILGLMLALASWLILNTINPQLVNLQFNIPPLGGTTPTQQQPPPTTQPQNPNIIIPPTLK